MKRQTIVVPEAAEGRIDRFVADASGLSRSYVQKLITEGHVTAAGSPDQGQRDRVVPGQVIELEVPDPKPLEVEAEPIPLSVVYEDDDLLIVDKPSGLVVHPAAGHPAGTLVNALLARDTEYGGIAGVQRPGIVHRLDRDTSGLLMVAKNDKAQASLMAQLKARGVKKEYLGLVHGRRWRRTTGRIEAPIGRDPHHRTRMAVVPDGRESVTGYRVRERLRRLDAAGAGPDHRPDAPDPGPPGGHRPSAGGRPCLRQRNLAPRAGRARPALPPQLADRAAVADGRPRHPGDCATPAGAGAGARRTASRSRRVCR